MLKDMSSQVCHEPISYSAGLSITDSLHRELVQFIFISEWKMMMRRN